MTLLWEISIEFSILERFQVLIGQKKREGTAKLERTSVAPQPGCKICTLRVPEYTFALGSMYEATVLLFFDVLWSGLHSFEASGVKVEDWPSGVAAEHLPCDIGIKH